MAAFRSAAVASLSGASRPVTLASLEAEHVLLSDRLAAAPPDADAFSVWRGLGVADPRRVPDLDVAAVHAVAGRTA